MTTGEYSFLCSADLLSLSLTFIGKWWKFFPQIRGRTLTVLWNFSHTFSKNPISEVRLRRLCGNLFHTKIMETCPVFFSFENFRGTSQTVLLEVFRLKKFDLKNYRLKILLLKVVINNSFQTEYVFA